MSDNRCGGLLDKPMKSDTTFMNGVKDSEKLNYLARQINDEYEYISESEHIITREELEKLI